MSDYKSRVEKAMLNHHANLLPKKRFKKHNNKPEAEFMLKLKHHLEGLKFSIDIIESKAVYNAEAGMYLSGKARPGFSDLVGNMPNGIACFIECKAKKRRNTVRPDQHDFLTEKINTNAFACVVDSIEYFELLYKNWLSSNDKKSFLLKELPRLAPRYSQDDFDLD